MNDRKAQARALCRTNCGTAERDCRDQLGGMPQPWSSIVMVSSSCRASRSVFADSSRRPPDDIARKPLVARFQTICRIWFSSASIPDGIVGQIHVDHVVVPAPRRCCAAASPCPARRGGCRGGSARSAAGARRPGTTRIVSLRRSDSRSTMSISCACSSLSGSSCRSTWIDPDIDASGLRISCAMPAAISPTAASRCCMRAPRSSRLTSVTSWNVNRYPLRPSGSDSVVTVRPISSSRPSGQRYC